MKGDEGEGIRTSEEEFLPLLSRHRHILHNNSYSPLPTQNKHIHTMESVKNAANAVSDKVSEATSTASKEGNKAVA